jgi:Predicted Zn-dependent protease (DUF2268)
VFDKMTRVLVFVSLVCLQLFSSARAATTCSFVDLMPTFWRALGAADGAAQMRATMVEPHPDLYNELLITVPPGADWASTFSSEKTYDDAHRKEVRAAERYLVTNTPKYMAQFERVFPDYRCDFTFYIAPSFGNLDGSAATVGGKYLIVFAPDFIPRIHALSDLKILIDHETFHVYHHQATGVFGAAEQLPTIEEALWSEGLATFASLRMNPRVSLDTALIQPGLPAAAQPHLQSMVAELRQHLGEKDEETYGRFFQGGNAPEGCPSRSGYYIGFLIAQDLSKRYSLQQLAHLKGAVLHEALVAELDRIGAPPAVAASP